jgi:hypothetical protein
MGRFLSNYLIALILHTNSLKTVLHPSFGEEYLSLQNGILHGSKKQSG